MERAESVVMRDVRKVVAFGNGGGGSAIEARLIWFVRQTWD